MKNYIVFIIFLCPFFCFGQWTRLGHSVESMNIHHRAQVTKGGVFGIDIAEGDTLSWRRFQLSVPSTWPDDYNNSLDAKVSFISAEMTDSTKKCALFADKANSADLSLKIVGEPSSALLEVGDKVIKYTFPLVISNDKPVFLRFFTQKNVKTVRRIVEFEEKPLIEKSVFSSVNSLKFYLKNSIDPYEGLWNFYDRTTTPLRAAPTGDYILATVRSADGYDIIYIDDRDGIPSQWQPLDVKGKLNTCDIPGVFDVVWYDRSRAKVGSRISGLIDGSIMTVNFPYYKTALRFNRVNIDDD